jgi:hypothetical protein
LAGSWVAAGLRHRASAWLNAASRPLTRNASTSVTPPACDTTPDPAASTPTRGYNPLRFFTWKVLLDPRDVDLR